MDQPRIRFLHPVGRSTLRQGLTVPVAGQVGWLGGIAKGQSVPVVIAFSDDGRVRACVRRINNTVGHLQFRYESREQAPLRDYLASVFGEAPDRECAVLEVSETQPHMFLFRPLHAADNAPPSLSLYKPRLHHLGEEEIGAICEFQELPRCLASVAYGAEYSQRHYNGEIGRLLVAAGWQKEERLLDHIGLRCDFEKNGVWLEVEFGNARGYYQDYMKFLLAHHYRRARCTVLLCPTAAFAQLLCDLGQRRAVAARDTRVGRAPSYSGMMSYEKAVRELPFLEFALPLKLVVAGIDIEASQVRP